MSPHTIYIYITIQFPVTGCILSTWVRAPVHPGVHTHKHTHSLQGRNTLSLLGTQLCMPGREGQEVRDGRIFPSPWTLLASDSLPSRTRLPRGSPGVTLNSFALQSRERQKKDYPAIQGCPGQNPGQNIVFKILENKDVPSTFEPAGNNGLVNR